MAHFDGKKHFFDLNMFFYLFPQKFFNTTEDLRLAELAHFDEKNTSFTLIFCVNFSQIVSTHQYNLD